MSQHTINAAPKQFVFGWDQPLMSFFLQVHDLTLDEDEQITHRYGASPDTIMYEVDELARVCARHGLVLGASIKTKLYGEKDDGV